MASNKAIFIVAIVAGLMIGGAVPTMAEGLNILYNTVSINLLDYNVTTLTVNDYIRFTKTGMENCTIKVENGTTYCGSDLTGTADAGVTIPMANVTGLLGLNSTQLNNNNTQANEINTKVNITDYVNNNNTMSTKISTDNTTQSNAINTKVNITDYVNNNNTVSTRFGLYMLLGENTTLTSWIGTKVNLTQLSSYMTLNDNTTITATLGAKANLSTNTATCGGGTAAQNVTITNGVISTQCATAGSGEPGGSYDDTTINATIQNVNNTLFARIGSDNTTQQNAINTKVNITDYVNNNNTIWAWLGTKLNITWWTSENTTIAGRYSTLSDNTTQGNRITGDNTTQANLITGNNNTLGNLITNNNNTQASLIGQKFNLTGGGLVTGNYNTTGNISVIGNATSFIRFTEGTVCKKEMGWNGSRLVIRACT